ncbi:MAG: SIS domain-containing protein [bacterium]|jgi:D-sedoheptulose 7-phosphate isomerase
MSFAESYRTALLKALESVDTDKVETAIDWFREARDCGRQIFVCGNGGSATNASHFVSDVLKSASYGKPLRFRILALNDSLPTMTAYANDLGYEYIFAEQLRNFARPGDLFMALSGSGNSRNVVEAMKAATELGCRTIALTGRDGGRLGQLAMLNINVREPHMGRIEDAHLAVCHMICYCFVDGGEAEQAR